ncbi:MAG: hypothetical protein M1832_001445 [Thelocarpon impressellum]|nr:MAG: hypothetical protein M1832_001445 [Thelocarpon impressellum]
MTSTPRSTLSVPPTQNTAPVLDFQCLYTHDLRRKAKRWQDGVLRFHTFNKRVMVYDESRNLVGDTHWREEGELAEGDELELDRAGAMVQVGEGTGRTEQDLSGLFARRARAPEGGSSGRMPVRGGGAQTPQRPARRVMPTPLAHAGPRSLNALLGTARGVQGRAALPTRSPFQHRVQDEGEVAHSERPRKKRQVENSRPRRFAADRSPAPRRPPTAEQQDVQVSARSPVEIVDLDPSPQKQPEELARPSTKLRIVPSRTGRKLRALDPPPPPRPSGPQSDIVDLEGPVQQPTTKLRIKPSRTAKTLRSSEPRQPPGEGVQVPADSAASVLPPLANETGRRGGPGADGERGGRRGSTGAWSREAFDLFAWRPPPEPT